MDRLEWKTNLSILLDFPTDHGQSVLGRIRQKEGRNRFSLGIGSTQEVVVSQTVQHPRRKGCDQRKELLVADR
jgi:hypothetical protein